MEVNVSNEYKTIIYSGDAKNKLLLKFNNVEFVNADLYVEKITIKPRIIPNGAKTFMLENFISTEVEMIMHGVDISSIVDQVYIAIGTLVGESYEYVPIGIFNIQGKPTTDSGKTTITLRDNSVKFDYGYNAKTLIDANGGSATKLQILQDICTTFGVVCNITAFLGDTDEIGIYDNTITGRAYISYIAGQAGRIPTINRSGELIFVDILNLSIWIIPLSIIEKYTNGEKYKISKLEYESGAIKYTSGDDTDSPLYLDSSNPYINSQEQVDSIFALVDGFEINSLTTGKIIGNPAIDSYDLISFTDGINTYTTLATYELIYNGVMTQTLDTQIGLEERATNVTISNEDTFKKNMKAEYDAVNNQLSVVVQEIETVETNVNNVATENNSNYQNIIKTFDNYTPVSDFVVLSNSVTEVQTNTYTKTQIEEKLIDGSVTMVKSTIGTFDNNGLTIEQTGAKTKSNLDAEGLNIIDNTSGSEENLLYAGYDDVLKETVVKSKNSYTEKYSVYGSTYRSEIIEDEKYGKGLAFFYIGE